MDVEIGGARLHYEIIGDGEPLVWLHGFLGSGEDWRHVFPDPPSGYRLIAPDMRGHGASTNPAGEFSFRQVARDTLALLDHLRIEEVRAIGVSGGGIALLHMAMLRPQSVSAMVVVSAPPYYPEQARAIQRSFSAEMLPDDDMRVMRQKHKHGEAQIERLFTHARAFADDVDDVRFSSAMLEQVTADTLIVFGDRDPFYPVPLAIDLFHAIPRSALWIVPHAGHAPVFGEFARPFRDLAIEFLQRDRRSLPAVQGR